MSSVFHINSIFFLDFFAFYQNTTHMNDKSYPIHSKIKELRNSNGWKQRDLAEKIGTDSRMISLYESGKSIPSAEVIAKIAEVFNVTADYILFNGTPKIPLKRNADNDFLEKLYEVDKLDDRDKEVITYMINSLITKNKVKDLVTKTA
jgi:transcriptional regulator with XRE-family HTH domain